MKVRYIDRVRRGWERSKLTEIGKWIITPWGIIWGIVNPSLSYSASTTEVFHEYGIHMLFGSLLISLIYVSKKLFVDTAIGFKIGKYTKINVFFGDIFSCQGSMVIPANEYFDSEIGTPVSSKSIHGQFISSTLGGNSKIFDDAVKLSLMGQECQVMPKAIGKKERYDIGTTAIYHCGTIKYYILAFSKTDLNSCKASADLPTLWNALCGLFKKIRESSGGNSVYIPLMGSGVSGMGICPQQLLRLMILSIDEATKQQVITSEINIVLHASMFNFIDLSSIKSEWS